LNLKIPLIQIQRCNPEFLIFFSLQFSFSIWPKWSIRPTTGPHHHRLLASANRPRHHLLADVAPYHCATQLRAPPLPLVCCLIRLPCTERHAHPIISPPLISLSLPLTVVITHLPPTNPLLSRPPFCPYKRHVRPQSFSTTSSPLLTSPPLHPLEPSHRAPANAVTFVTPPSHNEADLSPRS
jgi:hypothetical protein